MKKNKKKIIKKKIKERKKVLRKKIKKKISIRNIKKKIKFKKKIIKKIKKSKKRKIVKKTKKIKYKKNIRKKRLKKTKKKISNKILESIKIRVNFFERFKLKDLVSKFFDPLVTSYNGYIEKKKNEKIKKIEFERKEKEKKLKLDEKLRIELKEKELKDEIKIARERNKDIKNFLRKEQAQIRREQAERQRKFLTELKLEKQIKKFRIREVKELQNLEKISLKEQREDYAGLQERIEKLKEKYRAIRDQKIRDRILALGVQIQEGDDRETLLQREKEYTVERQKIENCLESFYRSSASLCFQINKRYIPKHKSILRTIDRRFETGEIFIKWDDSLEEDWLLLIYIKNNSPEEGVVIEDRTNPEKNISHEFKTSEIFKASDMMVDALTQLLEKEKKKAS